MKKSMLLAAMAVAFVLLLAIAQLALAQQDAVPAQPLNTTQQETGGTQGTGQGQSTPTDPSGQNNASQTQPTAGANGTLPNTRALLMRLNQNDELVIDCPAVSEKLAQLKATPTNDPQPQAGLVGAEELAQLCADGGFKPSNNNNGGEDSGSSPNGTGSAQPQQSQTTTPPSSDG